MRKGTLCLVLLILLIPVLAHAKPKKKLYNNSAEQVFLAALRTARERHVVTYVNEKQLMFAFSTGMSFTSYGFIANASVEPEGDMSATLILNVQNKQGWSMGAGDRMADKFFKQVEEELAGEVSQKSAVKPPTKAIDVPEAKAIPTEPSVTKPPAAGTAPETGKISLLSAPDGAEVSVDDGFVGNTPAELKLPAGKHTVKVMAKGYKPWTRELTVLAGSDVRLNAQLEKE